MKKDQKDTAEKPQLSPEVQARIDERRRVNEARREAARKKRAAKGVQVEPGMTWQDLTDQERAHYFAQHESNWKDRYNENQARKKGGTQGHQTLERGAPITFKA